MASKDPASALPAEEPTRVRGWSAPSPLQHLTNWVEMYGPPARGHSGGFARSAADVEAVEGHAEVVALVDHRFNERSPLRLECLDRYRFGGITRSAELHPLGATWIGDLRVRCSRVARSLPRRRSRRSEPSPSDRRGASAAPRRPSSPE